MYSFYKNQEIYDPKAISKRQKIIIFFKFFLSAIIFYWQNFLRLLDARQIVFIKWVLIKNRTNVFLEINLSFDCIFLEIYFAALDLISLTLLKIFQPGFTFSKTGSSEIFFSCRSENLSVERKGQRKKSRRKRR